MKYVMTFFKEHSIAISIVSYFIICIFSEYSWADNKNSYIELSTFALNVTLILTAIYGVRTWKRELWQKEAIRAADDFYRTILDAIDAIDCIAAAYPAIPSENYEHDIFHEKRRVYLSKSSVFIELDKKCVYFESTISRDAFECIRLALSIYEEYFKKLYGFHIMNIKSTRKNHQYTDDFVDEVTQLELYICKASDSELKIKIDTLRNAAREIQRKYQTKNPFIS